MENARNVMPEEPEEKDKKKEKEEEIKKYHALLDEYVGTALEDIESDDDLVAIKKGMGLPVAKRLRYAFRNDKPMAVYDTMIEEIYKPSYSCRLCVTTKDGKQHLILSDFFAEMQKPAKKAKAVTTTTTKK